jgi:kynureninase
VIPDFRAPDLIRFGLAPIYTSFEEVRDAVVRLRTVLKSGSYLDFSAEREGVTLGTVQQLDPNLCGM